MKRNNLALMILCIASACFNQIHGVPTRQVRTQIVPIQGLQEAQARRALKARSSVPKTAQARVRESEYAEPDAQSNAQEYAYELVQD